MTKVLAGVRVLDFGRFIAAPLCGAILADMGADVIRVERREGGEDRWVQPVAAGGEGASFLQCNRNKRSLTLDVSTPRGREIVHELVARADIVLANMPEGTLRSLGLDYATLKAIKPDIILAKATAYGTGGPYEDRVGFDGIGQVMAGGVYRSGPPEQPYRCVVPYVDFGTALSLATGIAMALLHRNATGEGQEVESALLPVALMMANGMLVEEEMLRLDRGRVGNRGVFAGPCDLFRLKDKWILVQVSGNPMFRRWCRLVGKEEWIGDPRFDSDDKRANAIETLNATMQSWCDDRDFAGAMTALDAARIPGGPVNTPIEAIADPNVQALRQLVPVDYPGLPRPASISATPFTMSATPGEIAMRAPLLGEHSDAILGALGYDAAAIAGLRAEHII